MNKKFIETVWSGAYQACSTKLLNLWQIDYSKSIRDIQEYKQYKWNYYNLSLNTTGKFIFSDDQAGLNATTTPINMNPQPTQSKQINIPINEGQFEKLYGITQLNKLITINNRAYQVERITKNNQVTTLFINENVLTGQTGLSWRYLSTLVCNDDVEIKGVSYGDILQLKIIWGTKVGYLDCRILGVNKNKIGFIFSLDFPIDGQNYNSISQKNVEQLLKSFNISYETDLAGEIIYKDKLLDIKNELKSIAWKRLNFEKELTKITILGEDLNISINKILRLSKITIDPLIKSIPFLQEYIDTPAFYIKNNKYYREDNNLEFSKPLSLKENKDYLIYNDSGYQYYSNLNLGSNEVIIPKINLLELKLEYGDRVEIKTGLNTGVYTIIKVEKNRLYLDQNLRATELNRLVYIYRRINSNWLVFSSRLDNTAPNRLWAEQTYIDNNPKIEENFGKIINFTINDHKKFNLPIPYKMIVSSLMYSYSRGSQLDTLKLGATAILGLPFTYHAGVIKEIDPTYQLNEIDGSPLYGRIIVEYEEYKELKQDIYYYPRGKQILVNGKWEDVNKELSGISTNPKTGIVYIVGDWIDIYQPLCKAVEVLDYRVQSDWIDKIYKGTNNPIHITKYHNGHLRANSDLYGVQALSLVKQFINQIKPKYTFIDIYAFKAIKDQVSITDQVKGKIKGRFWDGLLTIPPIARSYKDLPTYINWNNLFCYRYVYGTCFIQQGNNQITTDGGLITSRAGEFHDSPYIRPGDLFIIRGKDQFYVIQTIVSDTVLTIQNTLPTGEYKYAIYRPQQNPIMTGTINLTSGQPVITIPGIFSSGAQKGDQIVFWKQGEQSQYYKFIQLSTLDKNIVESGQWNYTIFRTKFLSHTDSGIQVEVGPTNWVQLSLVNARELIINKNDNLVINNVPYKILDWKPNLLQVYLLNTPTQGTYSCSLDRAIWNQLNNKDHYIWDRFGLKINSPSTCSGTNNNTTITIQNPISLTSIGVKPGWFIEFKTGPNKTDIGYGEGLWPIYEITNSTTLKMTRPGLGTGNYDYNLVYIK